MNPFYDNPYYVYQPQMYPYYLRPRRFNLQRTLNKTIRGIQIANQVIPVINQVRPLINNTRQGMALLKAMNHLDDIDLDEVEKEIKPIEHEELFENMV